MAPKRLIVKFDGKKTGIDYSGRYTQSYNLGCDVEAAAFDLCKIRILQRGGMSQKMDSSKENCRQMSFHDQGPSPGNTLLPQSGQKMNMPNQNVRHPFLRDKGPSEGNTLMPQSNPPHTVPGNPFGFGQ